MREVQLAYQKTLTPEKKKQWADFYKIPIVQYDLKGNYIKTWSGAIDVKLKIPFSFTNITACCNGKQKTAYGFTWKKLN